MDSTGQFYIAISVAALLGVIFGYSYIERNTSYKTVLLIAFVLFVMSFLFGGSGSQPSGSREGALFTGLTRLTGIIGFILGIFYAIRGPKLIVKSTPKTKKPFNKPNLKTNSNKCQQCGLVDWSGNSSCHRCGSLLSA